MADNPIDPEKKQDATPPKINIKSAEKKSDTTRIDLSAAKPPPSIVDKKDLPADADDYFKRSTMRIDIPPGHGAPMGGKKSDTTRIDIPATSGDASKQQTSKIDLSSAASSTDDVFKAKTIPVGVPTPPPVAPPGRPKTIQMKRPAAAPGESIIVSPETTANATEQARKSETARIDLSADNVDRPATRPKTIRIKRPDGTSGRKALAIARPSDEETPTPSEETVSPPIVDTADSDNEPGVFVGIISIAALVVAGILLYVLLAQTMAPNLPFPGRI
ncbi:MAG TPA: hypothetical protein PJ991_01555 [Kiritimatiellia bacterium]|nr:hypothetical protein [Kiritimatiellia bacterium]